MAASTTAPPLQSGSLRRRFGLRARIGLAVTGLFLAVIGINLYFTLSFWESEYRGQILSQQSRLATALSAGIEEKLKLAHAALIAASVHIPREALADADKAQAFLDAQYALLSIFDNGLFIVAKGGELIAESPFVAGPDRRGRSIAEREYFRRTVASKRPYISKPYVSTHHPGRPALIMTVPIFDDREELAGIFDGSFDLLGSNALASLSSLAIGKKGHVYIVDSDGTIITHPERSRIMMRAPRGANELFDRAMAGFDGSAETVNSAGVPVLSTVRHLKPMNWILGISYPLEEAYAPLRRAEGYFILAALLGTGVVLLAVWLMASRLTASLSAFAGQVETLWKKPPEQRRIDATGGYEVEKLARAFNGMLERLERERHALQLSEQRYRSVVETVVEGIVLQDSSGDVIACNSSAKRVFGVAMNRPLILESGNRRLVQEDHSPLPPEQVPPVVALRTGKVQSGVVVGIQGQDGVSSWVLMNSRPMFHPGEQAPYAVLTSFADITDRKRTTETLGRLNTELEDRVAARTAELEAFSYSVSHDLRAPLRAVSGFSSLLSAEYQELLGADGRSLLGRIVDAAGRMGMMINALLELSRLGRTELISAQVDLARIAREIESDLRSAEPQRSVEFVIPPALPAHGDPGLLHVVLQNLLGNAWKYTGKTPDARIELGATTEKNVPVFFVRDNGAGFDPAYMEKLFNPFQRLHTAQEFSGIGIGLATVKRIVTRHQGRAWAEGAVGMGATFYFTLGV